MPGLPLHVVNATSGFNVFSGQTVKLIDTGGRLDSAQHRRIVNRFAVEECAVIILMSIHFCVVETFFYHSAKQAKRAIVSVGSYAEFWVG